MKNFLRGEKNAVHDDMILHAYFIRRKYFLWHDTSYRPRTLHTAFVRESRFICKCHIFVRTFRWSLWFSSSQPLNLPSEDKKKGWCYYLRNLTVCSAPYKWQLSACVDREDIYRFISRWQQPRTVFRDKLIPFFVTRPSPNSFLFKFVFLLSEGIIHETLGTDTDFRKELSMKPK